MRSVAVMGLGYTGLPLAREASRAGMTVIGFDTDPQVNARLAAGGSHIPDVGDGDVAAMLAAGFRVSADPRVLAEAATVVICVPTPLDDAGLPDLGQVRRAARAAGDHLKPDTLVVLQSTSYPGTTDGVVRGELEDASGLTAGTDFHLAFSPERIDPGNPTFGIRNTPRVVGGYTAGCSAAAAAFFGELCDRVVEAGSAREAETAKLLENTYRSVNIALVNEVAVAARALGVDIWDTVEAAASKPFGFQPFRPGPGVGGHCIPVDPMYLAHRARAAGVPLRLVELAQDVNAAMPRYVVRRAEEVLRTRAEEGSRLNEGEGPLPGEGALAGARVLLVGVTYKRDCPDLRNTPAAQVARQLRTAGARITFHDPLVGEWAVDGVPVARVADLSVAARAADLAILLQDHARIRLDLLAGCAPLLLDTRGRLRGHPSAETL